MKRLIKISRYLKAVEGLDKEPEVDLKELGEQVGINFDEVDFEQFKMGYAVELEHGSKGEETNVTDDDPEMTAKIAWVHLKELPDYYTKLKAMEESVPKKADIETGIVGKEDAIAWFRDNPNPDDDEVHAWAESVGIDPHELEEIIYTLITDYVNTLG